MRGTVQILHSIVHTPHRPHTHIHIHPCILVQDIVFPFLQIFSAAPKKNGFPFLRKFSIQFWQTSQPLFLKNCGPIWCFELCACAQLDLEQQGIYDFRGYQLAPHQTHHHILEMGLMHDCEEYQIAHRPHHQTQ